MTTQKRQNSMLLIFSLYDAEDKYNIEFIENYAKINLIPEVQRVKGVGDANVMGQDYSMRIWLKPDVMAQYNLVPSDISGVLAEQNIELLPDSLVNVEIRHSNILFVIRDVCSRQKNLKISLLKHCQMEKFFV